MCKTFEGTRLYNNLSFVCSLQDPGRGMLIVLQEARFFFALGEEASKGRAIMNRFLVVGFDALSRRVLSDPSSGTSELS
jgi:hypothetical protein